MDAVWKVVAICLVGTLLSLLLKQADAPMGLLLLMGTGAVVLVFLLELMDPLLTFLQQLLQSAQLSEEIFAPLLKTLGIAIVVRVGSGLCRDGGSSAAAALIEMAGAFAALLVAMPILEAVLQLLNSLI